LKQLGLVLIFAFTIIFFAAYPSSGWTRTVETQNETHGKKHGFSVAQYDAFHDVLHPLQHEALPAKDFRAIRNKAALLAKRGNAIVRLGVPSSVTEANNAEFGKELSKFKDANAKFKTAATKGTDAELEASFNAVHDSFEMLAGMLPRA
jgi:hypothetical protein